MIYSLFIGPRFRQVTTFGVDTIRLFATNTSEMKKLAARDFEDILQVYTTPKDLLHSDNPLLTFF